LVVVADAPALPGLTFRRFRGEADYQTMVDIVAGSKAADGLEHASTTVEDVARTYRHLVNCDPALDMLFAQVRGLAIGYGRAWWQKELEGNRLYQHFAFLLPEWRGLGVRRALLRHNERRLRQIAASQPLDGPRFYESWAADTEVHWSSLLRDEGYKVVRYGFDMVRPDLEVIPDLPLPEGLEVQPVSAAQERLLWDAANEAFAEGWGETEVQETSYEDWKESPSFQPHLWQVAWDGDQPAGAVMGFIDEQENREYGRKRGYTEGIWVRKPWRRRGLARALIARSLRVMKQQGMEEAALGVDAQNPNRALDLYESMGFRVVQRQDTYRKQLDG